MDSNVWGAGGLFEKALEKKQAVNDIEAQAKMLDAQTNSRMVDVASFDNDTKRFDAAGRFQGNLGPFMRTPALFKGLGLRSMSSVPYYEQNQNNPFAPPGAAPNGPMAPDAPLTGAATSGPAAIRNSSMAMPAPVAGTSTTAPQPTSSFAKRTWTTNTDDAGRTQSVTDGFGNGIWREPPQKFANGGMVGLRVKPKMSQPGYKKGGKVMYCADGGPIGDVAQDEGKDTIDAKVRPGEYMLNPETVAHVGGGDYAQGVRELNQLVRDATGKEPGPTRMGKDKPPGFMMGGLSPGVMNQAANILAPAEAPASGWRAWAAAETKAAQAAAQQAAAQQAGALNRFQQSVQQGAAAQQAAAQQAALNRFQQSVQQGVADQQGVRQAAQLKYADQVRTGVNHLNNVRAAEAAARAAAEAAARAAPKAAQAAPPASGWREAVNGRNTTTVGDVFKGLRRGAGSAFNAAKAVGPRLGGAAIGAVPASAAWGALYHGFGTDTEDYYKRLGMDPVARSAWLPQGTKDLFARSLGVMSDVGASVADSVLLPANYMTGSNYSLRNNFLDVQENKAAEAARADKAIADAMAPSEQQKTGDASANLLKEYNGVAEVPAEAPKPSMRDMVAAEWQRLHSDPYATAVPDRERNLLSFLQQSEANDATRAAAQTKNLDDRAADLKKMAIASFQKPVLKDGEPTGETQFDENAYNLFEASVLAQAAERGIDPYRLPPAQFTQLLANYQDSRRPTDAIMSELQSGLRNAPTTRDLINSKQITRGDDINLSQLVDPNSTISLGDWAYSKLPMRRADDVQTVRVRIGGQDYTIPMATLTRGAKGNIDLDAIRALSPPTNK